MRIASFWIDGRFDGRRRPPSRARSMVAAAGLALSWLVASAAAVAQEPVHVTMETSMGTIRLELDPAKAPATVANFVQYAEAGFYRKTVFHRVIPGFMIQGGGYSTSLQEKITRRPIANEADNGLSNARGTIAMARTSDPHSATAQFFINHADNGEYLDHGKPDDGWGYTVFGRVVEGMDVVDRIAGTPTHAQGAMPNLPVEAVVIESVTIERADEDGGNEDHADHDGV